MNELHKREDVNVAPFQWVGKNDFDDLVFDWGDKPIVGFTVINEAGRGITAIKPQRGTNKADTVTGIQLINVARYDIVNIRFINEGKPWSPWLVPGNETDADVNNDNITKAHYGIGQTLVGICCRIQGGYGVTDFATASAPREPLPPKKFMRENR